MACAQAGKALAYSTFGDHNFADDVQRIYSSLAASKCTVGQLWKIITCLDPPKMKENEKQSKQVFQSVLDQLFVKN
nr:unnamed protein product [Spirometra erinaceieuropaei]